MLPILYRSNTLKEEFKNNGLGFIKNCKKCIVTEVRNGLYELELEMLITDRLADSIAVGMFIKALPNSKDEPQIFEIYSLSVTDTKITAKAQHIRYIAGGNVITERTLTPPEGTPVECFEQIQDWLEERILNPFEFDSDITTSAAVTAASERPIRLGDFLSGIRGSMLDVFGGEFYYDNFNISLLKSRGNDSGVCLRYGANISSCQQDSDISTVYSYLVPYAFVKAQNIDTGEMLDDIALYRYESIDLEDEILTYKRALAYDFSDEFTGDTVLFHNGAPDSWENWKELVDKLETVAQNYIIKNKSALTEPTVNIVVDVDETLNVLSDCGLCDTVKVCFEPLGTSVNAKIIRTEFDVLLEKYSKIELGVMKKTIADLFDGKNIGGA